MAKLDESTLVQMGREYPTLGAGAVVERMKTLARMARSHQTLCERYCNEGDFDPTKLDKLEHRIIGRMACADMFPSTHIRFQRDPRGATVKLEVPSGATNDWGREGLCVLA